jgi:hypothetical protein
MHVEKAPRICFVWLDSGELNWFGKWVVGNAGYWQMADGCCVTGCGGGGWYSLGGWFTPGGTKSIQYEHVAKFFPSKAISLLMLFCFSPFSNF